MRIINIGVILLALTASCSNGDKKQDEGNQATTLQTGSVQQVDGKRNYQYLANGDTISLTVEINGEQAKGELTYALKEKDKNSGTIEGVLKDSILLADYKFLSEGQSSMRQVAFKLSTDQAVEGYGEMKEQDGNMVFIAPEKLGFDEQFVLKAVGNTTK
ncbi:hypothetical protein [Sphingobacterium kitahiroshimense]|uniref:Lipoprotein n=1 Tax=Sphingobacterium kitahiroshimense TaxID=470446 RepID=A0ABV0BY18_9SPHI